METEMNLEACKCGDCGKHFNVTLMDDEGNTYTCSSCRESSGED